MTIATTATTTGPIAGLRCRTCGVLQPRDERFVCERCLGAVEPEYDLHALASSGVREAIERGPRTLWRYAPLLPCAQPARGLAVGWTPLTQAPRLGEALGIDDLWLKDDTRNPSLSFKDRPVALATARALELGLDTIACASTGNLAGAVAAAAAKAGLRAYVFVPETTEASKVAAASSFGATVVRVRGNYDRVNRLCGTLADDLGWGFVNFTLRPYYAEGSKTLLFEIAEQLGWRLPDHVVIPVGSGALLTRTSTAAAQLVGTRLVADAPCRISAAQPAGCAPVSDAVLEEWRPVRAVRRPETIASALAIGAPADGDASVDVVRRTGGSAASVRDADIALGCELLARTEGVLVEPAGGVVVATARELARRGVFRKDERVVLYLTGNGHKGFPAEAALREPIDADADAFAAQYPEARS
ncbi:MAG TPA: threonine synthase [Candidatus Limnocylindria bacterium]|nr:threonine synthase [Candidatus Limnocylindria bacterium]